MGIKVRSEVLRRLRTSLRTLGLLANPRTSSNRSGLPAPPTSHMNSLNLQLQGIALWVLALCKRERLYA